MDCYAPPLLSIFRASAGSNFKRGLDQVLDVLAPSDFTHVGKASPAKAVAALPEL